MLLSSLTFVHRSVFASDLSHLGVHAERGTDSVRQEENVGVRNSHVTSSWTNLPTVITVLSKLGGGGKYMYLNRGGAGHGIDVLCACCCVLYREM